MKKLLSFVFGLLLTASVFAADFGWNPTTGLEAFHGSLISQGTAAVVAVSGGGCGTLGTVTAGASAGRVIAGAVTTCQVTVTFPSAALNGWVCTFSDLTTVANLIRLASSTTTSCTTNAATIVSGDTFNFFAIGF